jgi:hypothetical protein
MTIRSILATGHAWQPQGNAAWANVIFCWRRRRFSDRIIVILTFYKAEGRVKSSTSTSTRLKSEEHQVDLEIEDVAAGFLRQPCWRAGLKTTTR